MTRRYVALLRGISNVRMQTFREALTDLGFTDVESYGRSGNLLFNSHNSDTHQHEDDISAQFRSRRIRANAY
jgi:uncharacterized protein (DUF1697 family)